MRPPSPGACLLPLDPTPPADAGRTRQAGAGTSPAGPSRAVPALGESAPQAKSSEVWERGRDPGPRSQTAQRSPRARSSSLGPWGSRPLRTGSSSPLPGGSSRPPRLTQRKPSRRGRRGRTRPAGVNCSAVNAPRPRARPPPPRSAPGDRSGSRTGGCSRAAEAARRERAAGPQRSMTAIAVQVPQAPGGAERAGVCPPGGSRGGAPKTCARRGPGLGVPRRARPLWQASGFRGGWAGSNRGAPAPQRCSSGAVSFRPLLAALQPPKAPKLLGDDVASSLWGHQCPSARFPQKGPSFLKTRRI